MQKSYVNDIVKSVLNLHLVSKAITCNPIHCPIIRRGSHIGAWISSIELFCQLVAIRIGLVLKKHKVLAPKLEIKILFDITIFIF